MPQIMPIKDLKDTSYISEMCHKAEEPIFIIKNGYGDMVIMSMAYYEQAMGRNAVYAKLEEARADVAAGRMKPFRRVTSEQRAKFNVHA